MRKIVVDVYGGDNAPEAILDGCLLALKKGSDFELVLVGKQKVISDYLTEKGVSLERVIIIDAEDVITNDDTPTDAIRYKKESSLVKAFDYLKQNDDAVGLVSAGSTGAVLTGATLKIGRIRGVMRPALCPLLPTVCGDKKVLIVDCGANVDCKPQMLLQFAKMGSVYAKTVCRVENPKVGLLSNGTEDHKGNEFTHQVFDLLKASNLNFVGNMEARDILSGEYDVVVSDGFNGNIAIKACEGTALAMFKVLKREVTSTFLSKIAASILKPAFKRVKKIMDYNEGGGALFLGVNKIVVKAHGSSKAPSIAGSIAQVADYDKDGLIEAMKPYFNNDEAES